MRITTLLSAAGALLAIVLFGAACSSTNAGSPVKDSAASVASTPAQSVLLSLQQSSDARTAKMEFKANISGIPAIGSQQVTGNGSVDFAGQKMAAHLEVLGLTIDGIVDGNTAYAKSSLFGENTWYKSDATAPSAHGLNGMTGIWTSLIDPAQLFDAVRQSSGSMTEAGHEMIRGADTIHYKGAIDLKERARAVNAPAEVLDAIDSSGISTLPIDVWVDARGYVARVQTSLAVSGSTGPAAGLSGDVTAEFFDYGKPVTISPPPAGQVKDASEALNSIQELLPKRTKTP